MKFFKNIFENYSLDWCIRFGTKKFYYYLVHIADFEDINNLNYINIRYDLLYCIHKSIGPQDNHRISRLYFICG